MRIQWVKCTLKPAGYVYPLGDFMLTRWVKVAYFLGAQWVSGGACDKKASARAVCKFEYFLKALLFPFFPNRLSPFSVRLS
jgi:hypothetical protein